LEITDLYGVELAAFEPERLVYPWRNPDSSVDQLQRGLEEMVQGESRKGSGRSEIFAQIWKLAGAADSDEAVMPPLPPMAARATVPYLTEPWYC